MRRIKLDDCLTLENFSYKQKFTPQECPKNTKEKLKHQTSSKLKEGSLETGPQSEVKWLLRKSSKMINDTLVIKNVKCFRK